MEIRVIDCDAIVGFVDYGTIDSEKNGGYSTKMRCKKCGEYFWQTDDERIWFTDRNMKAPCRCYSCRKKNKTK